MIQEQTIEQVKESAAHIGRELGIALALATIPTETKEAVLTVLPYIDLAHIKVGDAPINARIGQLRRVMMRGKVRGSFDDSTGELLVREVLIKNMLEAASFRLYGFAQRVRTVGAHAGDVPAALTDLQEYFGLTTLVNADTSRIIKRLAKEIFLVLYQKQISAPRATQEDRAMADSSKEVVCAELFDPIIAHPPEHAWAGPQPGLTEQVDERHRYIFSKHNLRLTHIILYDKTGVPMTHVSFCVSEDPCGAHVRADEISRWCDGRFVYQGKLNDRGEIVNDRGASLTTMIDAHGAHLPIPDEPHVYITPTGTVVKITQHGWLKKQMHATPLGHAVGFSPLKPFQLKTAFGVLPITTQRTEIFIHPHGEVFEWHDGGMYRVGTVALDDAATASSLTGTASNEPIEITHDFFVAVIVPHDIGADEHNQNGLQFTIQHAAGARALARPLVPVVGKHAFVHNSVPELIDLHGGTAAEEVLRRVERSAFELGLTLHALRTETRIEKHAALLTAQRLLEKKLWSDAAALELLVGYAPHTLVDRASVRRFVEAVAAHPGRAAELLARG